MALHATSYYTQKDPALVGVESCCSCEWVTKSPGGAKQSMGKEGMDQTV